MSCALRNGLTYFNSINLADIMRINYENQNRSREAYKISYYGYTDKR